MNEPQVYNEVLIEKMVLSIGLLVDSQREVFIEWLIEKRMLNIIIKNYSQIKNYIDKEKVSNIVIKYSRKLNYFMFIDFLRELDIKITVKKLLKVRR